MITIYGIPNCDTVKKVTTWFKTNNIPFTFFDYKQNGAPVEKLKEWTTQKDWTEILNKKSTTWRDLDPAVQAKVKDANSAVKLMNQHTSLIKRPAIEKNGKLVVLGFKEDEYKKLFPKK